MNNNNASHLNNDVANNNELHDCYYKYKNILSGAKTLNDSLHLLDNLKLPQQQKQLLLSNISNIKFCDILDNAELFDILKRIDRYKYREDAYELVNQVMRKTKDLAQIKCLTRKANSKPIKPQYMTFRNKSNKMIIEKTCLYCSHVCKGTNDTEYIICGYGENSAYDWDGCGCDWCFKCDKFLCKKWTTNYLFIQENRVHDSLCCKEHADANGKQYPQDYCQCSNDFVKRSLCHPIFVASHIKKSASL